MLYRSFYSDDNGSVVLFVCFVCLFFCDSCGILSVDDIFLNPLLDGQQEM